MITDKAIVVAYGRNREIGRNGDLPWGKNLPADLENFKKLTTSTSVIMGRKTFNSIKNPLPNRENIVISSTPTGVKGVLTALDLKSAYALARYPIFIIGGAMIYKESLDTVDVIYATEIDATFDNSDTFFPEIDMKIWREESRVKREKDDKNIYDFDFVVYKRR